MRVVISLTVEVDEQGWEDDYGVSGKAAIREDVKTYLRSVTDQVSDNLRVVK